MNWFKTALILIAAFLAVFWEAAFSGLRNLTGAQIDLLPSLVVYTALYSSLPTVVALTTLGGLWFDSLSANPLGVSVLPLFLVGVLVYSKRELLLRDQLLAQFVLGLVASAVVPVLTLLILLTTGKPPLLGWGTLWQLAVMSLGGGLAAPIWFEIFGWLQRTFVHGPVVESSFRPDREIRRGR